MRTLSAICLAAALTGGASACVSRADPAATTSTEEAPDVIVQVVNNRFQEVSVAVELGARRVRLGYASGHRTTNFRLPWRHTRGIDTLRILIDPVGSGRVLTSTPMSIQPGWLVSWVLQPEPGVAGS